MLISYVYTDPAIVSNSDTCSLSWLPRAGIQEPPHVYAVLLPTWILQLLLWSFTMAHLLYRQAELPDVTSCSLSIIKLTRSMSVSALRHQWHRLS